MTNISRHNSLPGPSQPNDNRRIVKYQSDNLTVNRYRAESLASSGTNASFGVECFVKFSPSNNAAYQVIAEVPNKWSLIYDYVSQYFRFLFKINIPDPYTYSLVEFDGEIFSYTDTMFWKNPNTWMHLWVGYRIPETSDSHFFLYNEELPGYVPNVDMAMFWNDGTISDFVMVSLDAGSTIDVLGDIDIGGSSHPAEPGEFYIRELKFHQGLNGIQTPWINQWQQGQLHSFQNNSFSPSRLDAFSIRRYAFRGNTDENHLKDSATNVLPRSPLTRLE